MFGLFNPLSSPSWDPKDKHVYITGGSTGLGLALAEILVKRGANVSIVARDKKNLEVAQGILENHRHTPTQKIHTYSYALNTPSASLAALEAVCEPYNGEAPDAVIACVGSAKPMFLVEMTEEDLVGGMEAGYWVQAWTAWAVTKKLVKQKKKGTKIVLVGSLLSYFSFVGYASYAPAKHALLGLAETLRSELILYETDVHIFMPPTMKTPGYDNENRTKPGITKGIEDTDEGLTPEAAAQALVYGVQHGYIHIAGDFTTKLFRASTRGSTPRASWIVDLFLDGLAYVIMPFWRGKVDKMVFNHRAEHAQYLSKKGFFFNNADRDGAGDNV